MTGSVLLWAIEFVFSVKNYERTPDSFWVPAKIKYVSM
jgi:hypothetical protein